MENKIKIIAFLNAYSQGKSGGDIVFIEATKRLPVHCQITVVTSGLGKELCEQSGLSARYFLTSCEKQFSGAAWLYFKRTIAALKLKLERKDRTVFWGTSDFLPDVLPAFFLKSKYKGARWLQVIHHLYANPFQRKGRNFFVNLIGFLTQRLSFFLIKRYANAVITVSALVKEQLLGLGFGPDKITVIHNGIDLAKLRGYAPSPQRYEAVFLGQHRVSKGIFDLLDIWRLVLKEAPQAVLALIGKGEQEIIRDLQKKIKDNSLEKNIRLLGYLPDEQAFPIIKASRVFVLPSYEEGFGIAPLEAQALGRPVVAWDLPVFDEIFPQGMFKAPKGDIRKFAEIVVRLLNNFEFYGQVSQFAAQNAGRYDWDRVAAKYLGLFEKLSDPSNL